MHYAALVDDETATLASTIGERVRRERQARRWTLDRLAEAAGVSRRMVISVEQGAVNPSVGTLLRLSDALGIGLPTLVEPPEVRPVKLTRRGEGAVLWSGDSGGRGVLVGGTQPPEVVELWDWTQAPGESLASEPHTPGTMELIQVQQGSLTVTVGDESFVLGVGDAVTYPGDVTHSYANRGRRPCRFTMVVFEPDVGSAPHQEAVSTSIRSNAESE